MPSKQDLIDAGVFHPNCTHSYTLVPDIIAETKYGITLPTKTRKQEPEPKPEKQEKKPEPKPEEKQEPEKKQEPQKQEPEETHAERRERQWNAAYDARRDEWRQSILDAGYSETIANELADSYTKEIARLGKPPKVAIEKGDAYYDPDKNAIYLDPDSSSWDGHPLTARHEFGHWIDFHSRLLDQDEIDAFIAALKKDWKLLKEKANGNLNIYKFPRTPQTGAYWLEASQAMFGKPAWELELGEQKILAQHMDALGSITKGRYGGGHRKDYYKKMDTDYSEAFAQAYAAYCRDDKQFQLAFPYLTEYIVNLMKKLAKRKKK